MKQKHFLKSCLILAGLIISIQTDAQIISQYVETNSGTTPKGIEIWNNTGSILDFSTNNLVIEKGVNGAAPSPNITISTGTLARNISRRCSNGYWNIEYGDLFN